jgi:hypothetical protein
MDNTVEVDEGPTTKDWLELIVFVVIVVGGIAIKLFA